MRRSQFNSCESRRAGRARQGIDGAGQVGGSRQMQSRRVRSPRTVRHRSSHGDERFDLERPASGRCRSIGHRATGSSASSSSRERRRRRRGRCRPIQARNRTGGRCNAPWRHTSGGSGSAIASRRKRASRRGTREPNENGSARGRALAWRRPPSSQATSTVPRRRSFAGRKPSTRSGAFTASSPRSSRRGRGSTIRTRRRAMSGVSTSTPRGLRRRRSTAWRSIRSPDGSPDTSRRVALARWKRRAPGRGTTGRTAHARAS